MQRVDPPSKGLYGQAFTRAAPPPGGTPVAQLEAEAFEIIDKLKEKMKEIRAAGSFDGGEGQPVGVVLEVPRSKELRKGPTSDWKAPTGKEIRVRIHGVGPDLDEVIALVLAPTRAQEAFKVPTKTHGESYVTGRLRPTLHRKYDKAVMRVLHKIAESLTADELSEIKVPTGQLNHVGENSGYKMREGLDLEKVDSGEPWSQNYHRGTQMHSTVCSLSRCMWLQHIHGLKNDRSSCAPQPTA